MMGWPDLYDEEARIEAWDRADDDTPERMTDEEWDALLDGPYQADEPLYVEEVA